MDVQGNHKIDIRKMGAASVVLLKNADNVLPLNGKRIKKLAVIGSDAGPSSELNCDLHACNDGTLAQGWGSGTANYPYLITVRQHNENYSDSTNQCIAFRWY